MTRIFSLATAVFVLALFLFAPHPAFASGVVSKVTGAEDFNSKLDTATDNIIGFLRKIGLLLAVVMLIWAGITFAARGGNPQALLDMKGRLIAAAVGIFLVFGAEMVVKFFTSIFGLSIEVK
ncbi:MAG: hypothetical protein HSCHL_0982 [Hydrogenibacillus schlegelii]|uniref:Conjugal transfer protein TrbC n=1 Tax=Hydrogenibacillus schlegelii TaxID=1484 RepID=A0A2T5G6T0_HYDSH|nr:TrbC/VirB2 family protein [Hydrogenibacillus schlegelii]PTQ51906.1 MAG: hypothetical protein HSCHL_0982 [Hydrogenibacillus schlegelii]